jgi:hypothetical protein
MRRFARALGRENVGIVLQRDIDGGLGRGGQAGKRWRGLQVHRLAADQRDIALLRGNQLRLCGFEAGAGKGEAAVGLGDIGAGQVADLEAVRACLEVDFERADILLVERHHGAIGDHIEIGGDDFREHGGLRRAQFRLTGIDALFRGADGVADDPALIDRDGEGRLAAEAALRRAAGQIPVKLFLIHAAGAGIRAAIRLGERHVLVGRAQLRPGGVQPRVGLIGLRERFLQGGCVGRLDSRRECKGGSCGGDTAHHLRHGLSGPHLDQAQYMRRE